MTDLISSVFATHWPTWADVQALLQMLLTADERRLVIGKAKEEAERTHREGPCGTPALDGAVPLVEPDWDPSDRIDQYKLEHYQPCLREGPCKTVPKTTELTGGPTKTK